MILAGLGAAGGSFLGKSAWDVVGRPYDENVPLGVREEITDFFMRPGELETTKPKEG